MNRPQKNPASSYNKTVHPGKKYQHNQEYKKETMYYCESCHNVWETFKHNTRRNKQNKYEMAWHYCSKDFPFAQKDKVNCPYCKDEDLDI